MDNHKIKAVSKDSEAKNHKKVTNLQSLIVAFLTILITI